MGKVILKPGKEKAIKNQHHWIFSGAIQAFEGEGKGEILPVFSSSNEFLGYAYFNRKSNIIGRMLSWTEGEIEKILEGLLTRSLELRLSHFDTSQTNAFRLVNGEGDGLPGLIVDLYNEYCVLQISTLGMEKLKPLILNFLKKNLSLKGIFEKSHSPSRKEEGLPPLEGVLKGEVLDEVEIKENGIRFIVSIPKGQKTGFFLDHREMRNQVQSLSFGKKVLNCFSYTGGFSLYAAKGGAASVTSVDISEQAIKLAKKNAQLNEFQTEYNFLVEDVFDFLKHSSLNYDLVILDPPAFAKKQKDIVNACRGYKEINRLAFKKMPKNSLLLTSSCSHFIDEKLFQQVVFQAAAESGRPAQIIGKHLLAYDHPINLYHPEGEYLKSLLIKLS